MYDHLQALREVLAMLSTADDEELERLHLALCRSFDALCAAVLPLAGPPPPLLQGSKPLFGHKMLQLFVAARAVPDEQPGPAMSPATVRTSLRVSSPPAPGTPQQQHILSPGRAAPDIVAPTPPANEPPLTPKSGRATMGRSSQAEAPSTPKGLGRLSQAESVARKEVLPERKISRPDQQQQVSVQQPVQQPVQSVQQPESSRLSRSGSLTSTPAAPTTAAAVAVSPTMVRAGEGAALNKPGVVVVSSSMRRSNVPAVVGSGNRFSSSEAGASSTKDKPSSPISSPGRVVVMQAADKPNKEEDETWKKLQLKMQESSRQSKKSDEALLDEMDGDLGRSNPLLSPGVKKK